MSDEASLRRSRGAFRGAALLLWLLALVFAGGLVFLVGTWERSTVRDQFESAAAERVRALDEEVALRGEVVGMGAALFDAAGTVTPAVFREFARAPLGRYEDVQALAWVPHIRQEQRQGFTERARAEGFGAYDIVDLNAAGRHVAAGQRADYFPFLYVEPVEAYEWLVGVDLGTISGIRAVLDEATDTGRLQASGRVVWGAGGPEGQTAIMLVQPVFDRGSAWSSVAERRARLQGFVVALVDVGSLVEQALGPLPPLGLETLITDRSPAGDAQLLYRYTPRARLVTGLDQPALPAVSPVTLSWQDNLPVFGRRWALALTPTPAFMQTHRYWRSTVAALGALSVLVLLGLSTALGRWRARDAGRPARDLSRANRDLQERIAEHGAAERRLRAEIEQTAAVRRQARVGYWRWDPADDSMWWSDEQYAMLGLSRTEAVPDLAGFLSRLESKERDGVRRRLEEAAQQQAPLDMDLRLTAADGSPRDLRLIGGVLPEEGRQTPRLAGACYDVGRYRRFQICCAALQQTGDTVMITDVDGGIRYVNRAFEKISGYARSEVIGAKPSVIRSDRHSNEFYRRLWQTIQDGRSFRDVFINRKKSGALYYEEKTITPIKDAHGRLVNFIAIGKEITQRMQSQQRLRHLAYHDILTELPNRALFMDRLTHALAKRHKSGTRLAILFLDTDEFKHINDTLGHEIGDRVLQAIGERVTTCVREGDTVARLGGDEFSVLLEEIGSTNEVSLVAQKILDALRRPLHANDHELLITASIGISLYPDDGESADVLLKHADTAMYRAKQEGRNNYQFYSGVLEGRELTRLTYESELHRAIEDDEFVLYFQPQVDLRSGRAIGVGAEALVRWQHPESGLIEPLNFIPKVEASGEAQNIMLLGRWVLRSACQQANAWRRQGIDPFRLSVNFSGRQFSQPQLLGLVTDVLEETGFDPKWLEIEITELSLMRHDEVTRNNLNALRRMGVKVAIDDFGVGYSSLSYLRSLPIDVLKIDRSFVADIDGRGSATIVAAIIAMAHSLGLDVIAEGVETVDQMDFLSAHGCYLMQGFLFSKPLPPGEMSRLLIS